MKKILVAIMATMMTMGLMAQCPKQKEVCSKQRENCKIERADCAKQKACVYSSETRAMMKVDCIASVVKDLTASERKSLVDFYKSHFLKVENSKKTANPMTREECKRECDAGLRKVIGDERYIKYLEAMKMNKMNCEKRSCCHRGERVAGCQKSCSSACGK